MPDEEINVDDRHIKYRIFHRKTKFDKDAELFPRNGKPSLLDVKQGYTDLDCYFLSVLGSLTTTKEGQDRIFECFPDYKSMINENDVSKRVDWFKQQDRIKISFFKPYSGDNTKLHIIVDKTALRKKGVPWVRLLEKAFAVYKARYMSGKEFEDFKKALDNGGKIKSKMLDGIQDGNAAFCAAALTGEKYTNDYDYKNISRENLKKFSKDDYTRDVREVFDDIKKAINNNKVVVANAAKGIKIYSKGLFLMHIYTITGVAEKNGKKFIIVRNPYSGRSRVYKEGIKHKMHSKVVTYKEEDKKGVSELELNDFCKYFESYIIGTKEYFIDRP